MEKYVQGALAGDKRSAAKLISLVENDGPEKQKVLSQLHPHTGNAYIIGVTGSPGAGKSSLTDCLTKEIRKLGLTVGIIAVDPSSPFSGGALLGDRIRMQDHALDKGVFIRSMGTRGSLGGLARATKEAIRVLDAYGSNVIIVETVGVGQSELDIMDVADTTIVVLTPGAGDHIQTIKAGIMEIADIFVVNKADLDGAEKVRHEVLGMLDLTCHGNGWRPPVLLTVTSTEQGIVELIEIMNKHKVFLESSGLFQQARKLRLHTEVLEVVEHVLRERIHNSVEANQEIAKLVAKVEEREIDPYLAAEEIIALGI
ncbi:MAG: methylmalonyl Co-A mutase-associated GTPase MeaB [Carboxydocellales bacterium]